MANVLFLDDEEFVLSSLRRELRKFPHVKFFAKTFHEAKNIMERNVINVLVTDMKMPEVNGLEVLKYVKANYPYTVKIVLSGYTQITQVIATINSGDIFRFITKPWKHSYELLEAINDAINYSAFLQSKIDHTSSLENKNLVYQKILSNFLKKKENMEKDIRFVISFYEMYIDITGDRLFANSDLRVFKDKLLKCFPLEPKETTCDILSQDIISLVKRHCDSELLVNNDCKGNLSFSIPGELLFLFLEFYISEIIFDNTIEDISIETTEKAEERSHIISILLDINVQDLLNLKINPKILSAIAETLSVYFKINYAINNSRAALQVKIEIPEEP